MDGDQKITDLSPNRPIHTFCKHMTSPTVAVRSTVKHDPSRRKQIERIVKLDYVLTTLLWVTNTIEYGDIQSTS